MNFECQEINISNSEFGCTISLYDTIDKGYDENQTFDDIINSTKKYLMIQRTYPEDVDENDFYYIESSETDVEFGSKDKILIDFKEDLFIIQWSGARLEIGLRSIESKTIEKIKSILKLRFKDIINK